MENLLQKINILHNESQTMETEHQPEFVVMKITVMLFQSIKVTSLTASTHQSC